jgi:hypothetical protein
MSVRTVQVKEYSLDHFLTSGAFEDTRLASTPLGCSASGKSCDLVPVNFVWLAMNFACLADATQDATMGC